MGADASTCLSGIELCCFRMGSEDHITGLINNSVAGIGGNIIEQLCGGLVFLFCGGCLLRSDVTKGPK